MPVNAVKDKRYRTRHKKVVDFKELQRLSIKLKKEGKKVVFTIGSFDLLNPGHCRYLAEAKAKGDVLVVGVSSDSSDMRTKGSMYPLVKQEIRAELVSYLKTVDYVTVVEEDRPHSVLILLQPDIFFTSDTDWGTGLRDPQERTILKMYGGKIIKRAKHEPFFSNDALVEHIANIRVLQILESYLKDRVGDFTLDPSKHLPPADFGKQIPNDKKAYDGNGMLVQTDDLAELGNKLRSQGRSVVLVSGSYDLLHVGHARFIEQAGLLGDVLFVVIPADKSLRELKGIGRPVITEHSRAYVLSHLDPVDYVTVFSEHSVLDTLEKLKPDIFFTVDEAWNKGYKDSPEYRLVHEYGGKIVRVKRQAPFLSASTIIDRAAQEKVRDIFKECMDETKYQKILLEKPKNGK